MGLPVVCTNHVNQRSIVKEGVFIDILQPGALTAALRDTPPETWARLRQRGVELVRQHYDLDLLKRQYIERYAAIAATPVQLPAPTMTTQLRAHLRNAARRTARLIHGHAR